MQLALEVAEVVVAEPQPEPSEPSVEAVEAVEAVEVEEPQPEPSVAEVWFQAAALPLGLGQ